MFTHLVESRPDRKRSRSSTALSFVTHYGLVLAVLYTSAEAKGVGERRRDETVRFVEPPKVEPQQKEQPPELVVAPPPSRVAPSFTAPIEIPDALPEIDLSKAPTDPKMFESRRGPVGPAASETINKTSLPADHPYLDFQVDKPATHASNSAVPVYPDVLRQAGVEGEALVSFVVDTLGRVDLSSFKVIRTTHELFATAVRAALPKMRFNSAETTAGKVRQLVQQPFTFTISR